MKSIASLKVGSMPGFMQRTYGRVANTRIGGVLTKERSLMSSGSKRAPHVRRIDCVGACFVAGTQVLTDQGLKNIEDIKVGDFVLSKDELTKKSDYKPVVNLLTTHPYVLFTITYKDIAGEAYEIKVSGEHPFWVADKGWVSARQLAIDDKLIVSDENIVVISSITSEKAPEGKTFTTYNFEVADYHTYFVLQEGKKDGVFAVWVHNVGGCDEVVDYTTQLRLDKESARAKLRNNLNSSDPERAHHLAPLQAIDDNRSADIMVKAARGGFDPNGANNGVKLSNLFHKGGHAKYNERMIRKISKIDRTLSDIDVASELQRIVNGQREFLKRIEASRLKQLENGTRTIKRVPMK